MIGGRLARSVQRLEPEALRACTESIFYTTVVALARQLDVHKLLHALRVSQDSLPRLYADEA